MSTMFNDYKEAFDKQEERIEEIKKEQAEKSGIKPVMVGAGAVKVLAINPTEEQLKEIIGEVATKFDTDYKTSPSQYHDNKPSRPIAVWITSEGDEVSPTLINFRLVDTPRLSRDGKPQYWNLMSGTTPKGAWNILTTLWSNDVSVGDVQEKESTVGNSYTNTVLAPVRIGEENYYYFLKTLLGWPDDSTFMEAMKKVGLDFDTVFSGDFSSLHRLVEEELSTVVIDDEGEEQTNHKTFIGIFTAKLRDDGRVTQSFCMNKDTWFVNNYGVLTKKDKAKIEDLRTKRFARDAMDIIKDLYTLDPLTEYSEEAVKQNVPEDTNVDDWFQIN